ncbi:hypothetical protein JCM19037_4296 [Geomicrobium sp. JCM 19037]|uniref:hypothetical protein n=1 Tax=unclassified Geomicrobium TaxID=2628951 RepID=UPI00045F4715|nr:hypothetical protein [Geomicrobium sp. JCM 19037]GAK05769.1 hypothetical protein JCM19037_4296 [Geomicrobium sp. JCM 19037]
MHQRLIVGLLVFAAVTVLSYFILGFALPLEEWAILLMSIALGFIAEFVFFKLRT